MSVLLFILGLAFGSFINVLAVRYEPDRWLVRRDILVGRSHCPHCGKVLSWFELVPLLSFILQRGRCRQCHRKLSLQYPLAELISGFIFVSVPYYFGHFYSSLILPGGSDPVYLSVFWIIVFLTLLLLSLIDFRLKLIPDEISVFLTILGILNISFLTKDFGLTGGSFAGPYALLFGFRNNVWQNHLLAAFLPAILLLALIIITRGRGMGMGDVKLVFALGLIFGWPDVIILLFFAFLLGSIVGVFAILAKRKTMKGALPFGPFMALGGLLVFWASRLVIDFYFKTFNF